MNELPAAAGAKPADTLSVRSDSPAATRALGATVGRQLVAGDVVALAGTLGTGKTLLAKGIAAGLGLGDVVTSPTYVIVAVHQGGRVSLCHVDLYRLRSAAELDSIDWDGLLDEPSVFVVEWPERAGERLPAGHLVITLTQHSHTVRNISLTASGGRARAIVQAVRAATHEA